MKLRALLILLVVALALVPVYYMYRWLERVIQPRAHAARFFLFILANFVLVVVYTVLLVGFITKLIPVQGR